MVTATLPCLSDDSETSGTETGPTATVPTQNARDSVALSVESDLTITPDRFSRSSNGTEEPQCTVDAAQRKPSILAGYVGLFTGLGALVALLVFLPLPAQFSKIEGVEIGEALMYAYYVVGAISILVASFVYIGLRKLKGEEGKGFRTLFGLKKRQQADGTTPPTRSFLPYKQLLKAAVVLGVTDSQIGLGYLGGFVARASTVAISTFIPLVVKVYSLEHDAPEGEDKDKTIRQAYILASILTGMAQLFALVCAPVFGYLSSRRGRVNYPIVVATVMGVIGYTVFPNLSTPEIKPVNGRSGSPAVFLLMALIGISQIGAIVCSLGTLSKGILTADVHKNRQPGADVQVNQNDGSLEAGEGAPLLGSNGVKPEPYCSRIELKGTISGVYSLCGGAAILLLTKLGGYLFDAWSHGAPFYMMAIFNAMLLVAALGVDLGQFVREKQASSGK